MGLGSCGWGVGEGFLTVVVEVEKELSRKGRYGEFDYGVARKKCRFPAGMTTRKANTVHPIPEML